ncbi:hypothetical protein HPP92_019653 [Vanilla planifolia]|uniref:Uncharacterized protein n=1 Tax=Vanilla planifolia TaxID=51239 RepID=A0A835UJI6_VANPL|nr:hypothetical protein HPP92_019653 [Vanilla planifolia]
MSGAGWRGTARRVGLGSKFASEPGWEKEAVECLRVGYLCTARSLEKEAAMAAGVAVAGQARKHDAGDGRSLLANEKHYWQVRERPGSSLCACREFHFVSESS